VIWALIIGFTLAAGLIGLASQMFQSRYPKLGERLGRVLPGYRFKRKAEPIRLSDFWLFLKTLYRKHLSDVALTRSQNRQLVLELPDYLDLLSVALSSGVTFHGALKSVNLRASGIFAQEVAISIAALDMGSTQDVELVQLRKRLAIRPVEEFANKVLIAQIRGTSLAASLQELSNAIRNEIRNQLLTQAGKNETRMLIPLVFLILPVTILFAIYPSLQLINLSYF
jgi:tight adherence protein C